MSCVVMNVVSGGPIGHHYRVEAPGGVVGRDSSCTVPLDGLEVSGRHALLSYKKGEWLIRDLGSTNGTRLNGVRVRGDFVHLPPEGKLSFAGLKLRYRIELPSRVEAPAEEATEITVRAPARGRTGRPSRRTLGPSVARASAEAAAPPAHEPISLFQSGGGSGFVSGGDGLPREEFHNAPSGEGADRRASTMTPDSSSIQEPTDVSTYLPQDRSRDNLRTLPGSINFLDSQELQPIGPSWYDDHTIPETNWRSLLRTDQPPRLEPDTIAQVSTHPPDFNDGVEEPSVTMELIQAGHRQMNKVRAKRDVPPAHVQRIQALEEENRALTARYRSLELAAQQLELEVTSLHQQMSSVSADRERTDRTIKRLRREITKLKERNRLLEGK